MEPDAPLLHTSEADTRHAVSKVSACASATALVGVVALSACGGGSGGAPAAGVPTTTTPPTVVEASRFLGHAGFGGTDTSIAEVVTKGYSTWIADQIAMTRTQTHEAWLIQQGKSSTTSSTDGANIWLNTIWRKMFSSPDVLEGFTDLRCTLGFNILRESVQRVLAVRKTDRSAAMSRLPLMQLSMT